MNEEIYLKSSRMDKALHGKFGCEVMGEDGEGWFRIDLNNFWFQGAVR